MPWPPTIPGNTFVNLDPQQDAHPDHHNQTADALGDIADHLASRLPVSPAAMHCKVRRSSAQVVPNPNTTILWDSLDSGGAAFRDANNQFLLGIRAGLVLVQAQMFFDSITATGGSWRIMRNNTEQLARGPLGPGLLGQSLSAVSRVDATQLSEDFEVIVSPSAGAVTVNSNSRFSITYLFFDAT